MKGAILLVVILAGLVSVHGSWEKNKMYKYKVEAKTSKVSSESRNGFVTSQFYLTIRPQSEEVLIGQITQAEFDKLKPERYDDESQQNSDSDDRIFGNLPLNKPFKIYLWNGVIQSLEVDDSLSILEVNQLTVILSQFQVDTNGRNVNSFNENQLSQVDSNNAFYKIMESSVSGHCETIYDISPIPDYLIKSHPEWIPLPELKQNDGEFVEILKTRNSTYCNGMRNYLLNFAAVSNNLYKEEAREDDFFTVETQRIVISGSLQRYTIQSVYTIHKLMNSRRNTPLITDYINCTLESVESDCQHSTEDLPKNLKIVGFSIYDSDTRMDEKYQPQQTRSLWRTRVGSEEFYTIKCWSFFVRGDDACHSDFGDDWSFTGKVIGCGSFNLGVKFQCRRANKLIVSKRRCFEDVEIFNGILKILDRNNIK